MCRPEKPALYRQRALLLILLLPLVVPIYAKRFRRHFSGQPALNYLYKETSATRTCRHYQVRKKVSHAGSDDRFSLDDLLYVELAGNIRMV